MLLPAAGSLGGREGVGGHAPCPELDLSRMQGPHAEARALPWSGGWTGGHEMISGIWAPPRPCHLSIHSANIHKSTLSPGGACSEQPQPRKQLSFLWERLTLRPMKRVVKDVPPAPCKREQDGDQKVSWRQCNPKSKKESAWEDGGKACPSRGNSGALKALRLDDSLR